MVFAVRVLVEVEGRRFAVVVLAPVDVVRIFVGRV